MESLVKDTLDTYILPNLSIGERGKACSRELIREVVGLIVYRLKAGCQWRILPLQQFFSTESLSWTCQVCNGMVATRYVGRVKKQ